jgi:hypothetical protein
VTQTRFRARGAGNDRHRPRRDSSACYGSSQAQRSPTAVTREDNAVPDARAPSHAERCRTLAAQAKSATVDDCPRPIWLSVRLARKLGRRRRGAPAASAFRARRAHLQPASAPRCLRSPYRTARVIVEETLHSQRGGPPVLSSSPGPTASTGPVREGVRLKIGVRAPLGKAVRAREKGGPDRAPWPGSIRVNAGQRHRVLARWRDNRCQFGEKHRFGLILSSEDAKELDLSSTFATSCYRN